jgi:hypothetical protein
MKIMPHAHIAFIERQPAGCFALISGVKSPSGNSECASADGMLHIEFKSKPRATDI